MASAIKIALSLLRALSTSIAASLLPLPIALTRSPHRLPFVCRRCPHLIEASLLPMPFAINVTLAWRLSPALALRPYPSPLPSTVALTRRPCPWPLPVASRCLPPVALCHRPHPLPLPVTFACHLRPSPSNGPVAQQRACRPHLLPFARCP